MERYSYINNELIRKFCEYERHIIKFESDEDKMPIKLWIEAHKEEFLGSRYIFTFLCRPEFMSDRDMRLFAVWCARESCGSCLHPKLTESINVVERFANGKATEDELSAARSIAFDLTTPEKIKERNRREGDLLFNMDYARSEYKKDMDSAPKSPKTFGSMPIPGVVFGGVENGEPVLITIRDYSEVYRKYDIEELSPRVVDLCYTNAKRCAVSACDWFEYTHSKSDSSHIRKLLTYFN